MPHERCSPARLAAAVLLSATFLVTACADGVPLDQLFPTDAGHAGRFGSAGSAEAIERGVPGVGGSNDGGGGSSGSGGSSDGAGAGSGGAESSGSPGGGGALDRGGAGGAGGSPDGCSAPAWDSMTIYCGQGSVGTYVSLAGKKYACHYWTQAQNPGDHNSADNSEPWSTPTSCP